MLHEGISEAGCVASATAAGSSYSTHGEPMIPFYIFYSMFGFQRTGDSIWAMADQLARGFLIGATAGRTTLTGEGLQHADGHSPLLALTNPAVVHYDPAFAYEIAHIVQDGLRRMYGSSDEHPHGEDVIYYLTVYNEPTQPAGRSRRTSTSRACSRGIYHLAGAARRARRTTRRASSCSPAASGCRGSSAPSSCCADDWGVAADLWSVTSWNELSREALAAEEWNLMHPLEEPRTPYVTGKVADAPGPVVAVSDYMRAVPADDLARGSRSAFHALGADGFGFADTRPAARRFFKIDAESVVVPGPRPRSPRRAGSAATRCRRRSTTTGSTTPPRSPASSRRAATPSGHAPLRAQVLTLSCGPAGGQHSEPADDPDRRRRPAGVRRAHPRPQAPLRLRVPRAVGDVGGPGARAAEVAGAAHRPGRPDRQRPADAGEDRDRAAGRVARARRRRPSGCCSRRTPTPTWRSPRSTTSASTTTCSSRGTRPRSGCSRSIDDLLGDWRRGHPEVTNDVQVVGDRWSDRTHELKTFLARNHVPYRWYDVERDEEGGRLFELAGGDRGGPAAGARPRPRAAAGPDPARGRGRARAARRGRAARCTTCASSAAGRPAWRPGCTPRPRA